MNLDGLRKTLHQVGQIAYRPALLSNIAKAYANTLLLRRPTLRVCEFSITWACQSRCEFCYASKFHKPGEPVLSLDEVARVWGEAKRMGAFSSILFGGEPLLHPQFLDIVAVLEPRKHIVTFTTNALALDEPLIRELKRLGVFLVNISLNSLDPAVNDKLRGHVGHFDKAMRAIELCRKHGMRVYLPVATAAPYLRETLELVEFATREGLGVTINLMTPVGRAETLKDDLFDEEFWGQLRRLYNSHPNLRSDFDVNLSLKVGCPAGFEKVHVAPHGDVTGCSMNPVSFGNVRERPLEEIVARMRTFRHFAKRHPSCIVAVDKEYIADYLDFAAGQETHPYPVEINPHHVRDMACTAGPVAARQTLREP
ncbi:MAG TPA: radical SAM protein [Nitratidesulfovibrio sp.]|nr:radical SAM protein [Nitratidesulfovibrio sp.]